MIATKQVEVRFKPKNFEAEHEWSEKNINQLIISIVDYLKEHDDTIATHTHVGDSNKISVMFIGRGFADCFPFIGRLVFGSRIYENEFNPTSFGYEREKPYIEKRCKTKSQCLCWLVLHEYCHLFKNHMLHDDAFFKLIDDKYEKFFKNFL